MSATVLLAGFAEAAAREIEERCRAPQGESFEPFGEPFGEPCGMPLGEPRQAGSVAAALAELARPAEEPLVVCFGPLAAPRELASQLHAASRRVARPARLLVLAAGAELDGFAGLLEEDLLFYLAARPPAPSQVAALLAAAAADLRALPPAAPSPAAGEVLRRVLEIERSRGLEEALASLEAAAQKLVPARRAGARWLDAETATLWRPGSDPAQESRDSIASGLTGFAARTGRVAAAERIGEDARYDAEADNGRRSPRERFLAVPLPAGPGAGAPGAVEAVLTLARGEEQPPFAEAEVALALALAREAGPILRRRRAAFEWARIESETAVFRRQALDHHENGARPRQDPLRLAPPWIALAYRSLVLLSVLVLLLFLARGGELLPWLPKAAP